MTVCIGQPVDKKQMVNSADHMKFYIDDCRFRESGKSHIFYSDIVEEEVRIKQRDGLINFFQPIYRIVQASLELREHEESLPSEKLEIFPGEKLESFFVDRFLLTYIRSPISNCDIPSRLQARTFLKKSNRVLVVKENEVIKQCVDTSAYALDGWSLDDITDNQLTYVFYPAVRTMLKGPDSIIHFSQLDSVISKGKEGKDSTNTKTGCTSRYYLNCKKEC